MRRWLVQIVLTLVVCALALGGVILLGQYLRRQLRDEPRYQFPVAEIECSSPPGLSRAEFLSEVQYLNGLPEQVSLLDDSLAERLTAAFVRHAWVERVQQVEIGPGRRIRVQLQFRLAALAITYSENVPVTRAVDKKGILLPCDADVKTLPVLMGIFPPPIHSPGKPWGDPEVEAAARVAGLLQPHQGQLKLNVMHWTNGTLRLGRNEFKSGPTIIWGHGPGDEVAGEPAAEEKVRRVLDFCAKDGGLEGGTLDMTN
ncbi:MAG TPA: hypothetical protein VKS79_01565 [Gemmataceae bacterium]|nr:hypothetical protein [Gemmataceae bacterium]